MNVKTEKKEKNLLYEQISIHVHTTLRPSSGNQMSRPLINRFKRNDVHFINSYLACDVTCNGFYLGLWQSVSYLLSTLAMKKSINHPSLTLIGVTFDAAMT